MFSSFRNSINEIVNITYTEFSNKLYLLQTDSPFVFSNNVVLQVQSLVFVSGKKFNLRIHFPLMLFSFVFCPYSFKDKQPPFKIIYDIDQQFLRLQMTVLCFEKFASCCFIIVVLSFYKHYFISSNAYMTSLSQIKN